MLTNNRAGHCIANIAWALHHFNFSPETRWKQATQRASSGPAKVPVDALSWAEQNYVKAVKHYNISGACSRVATEAAVTSSREKYSSTLRVCPVQINLGGQWKTSACCFLAGCAHGFMANFWSELNPAREVNNWTCQIITISKSNCVLFLQRGILNQWAILLDSCSCNKNMC